VYRVATRGLAVGKVRAITILAHHGDAAALFAEDRRDDTVSSWAIRRDMKVPSNQNRRLVPPSVQNE